MLLSLVAIPTSAGLVVWIAGDHRPMARAVVALGAASTTVVVAVISAATPSSTTWRWGAGLEIELTVVDVARAPIVLVAIVALAVVTYALHADDPRGRSRLVGLLLVFAGAMELVLLAGGLLTLIIGWELIGLISWALISHHWRAEGPPRAAHAFVATRAGDLGLVAAAGAAFAATGSLDFDALARTGGGWAHVVAAGVVLAATAKSAQLPFSPWLFSAMAGPTPASALLHAAAMVAAGAYLLARLHPFLDTVSWFAPTAIGIGLTTALAGGVVAYLAPGVKELLAASTSAQYGLMFVAVGAGYPAVAIAHLVAHGLFKSLLFVAAGEAIDVAGTEQLAGMRLGRRLRPIAALAAVGAVSLAAIPPLGAAWTKEHVVAAASHATPWVGVAVILAGGLSALDATRFQLVAFGRRRWSPAADRARSGNEFLRGRPGTVIALAVLAAATLGLSGLWLPWGEERFFDVTGGTVPPGATWEAVASLSAIVVAVCVAVVADRGGLLAAPATSPLLHRVADWCAIGALGRVVIVDPTLRLAGVAARFDDRVLDAAPRAVAGAGRYLSRLLASADDRVLDAAPRAVAGAGRRLARLLATGDDRVVDAGVRGVARSGAWSARVADRFGEWALGGAAEGLARLTGQAGHDGRRLQTGMTHHYYVGIAVTFVVLVVAAVTGR